MYKFVPEAQSDSLVVDSVRPRQQAHSAGA